MKVMIEDAIASPREATAALDAPLLEATAPAAEGVEAVAAAAASANRIVEFPRRASGHVARFSLLLRVQHLALMASFLVLAATGLPLLFSDAPWAAALARFLGGFHTAGLVHRMAATMLIAVFLVHVATLFYRILIGGEYGMLWGPESMVPQPRDLVEMVRHVRWFVGLGARPKFDHFTYWEKFDYWAVFWGMLIIGGSGLMLWFPIAFSRVVPGWAFNIALLVHGEEALLAVAFIFTIHFFNGHLRPEKFPMDPVIFTGRVPAEEWRAERPGEYERYEREGRLDTLAAPTGPEWLHATGRIVGTIAVLAGLGLFGLILFAVSRR
jgi:cytochrome b subunit of formate dehydrogenase